MDLAHALPQLLPEAVRWVESEAGRALQYGGALDPRGAALARSVGVAHPERIRVAEVDALPLPPPGQLQQLAYQVGLYTLDLAGLTFGYAVFIRRGQATTRLLSHEFRHVHQYEQAGSVAAFLHEYLQQIATMGYQGAPLEVDARNHETDAPPW